MAKRAFSLLDMPRRSEKPRVNGMTMCIDQGLGFDFVKGLLEMSSHYICLLYTSPSPRDRQKSRMPSSA